MGDMSKLLNQSLRRFILYAGLILACCIPVYYYAISRLWQYELDEHKIVLTPEAGREDRFLIIGAVTLISVLFFILLIIGLVLVNKRLSKRMWEPFYTSLEKIKSFDLNRHNNVVFEKTDITEFDELNGGLRKLIDTNLAVYNQQKEFADNASHELQTPLAVVQSKLELLSQSQTLNDEQYHLIEEALAALSRAGRVNKNLLLLTKIENSQFADRQLIEIGSSLIEMVEQLRPFFEDKQIDCELEVRDSLTIEGNKSLVEILLSNLITNAIRYSNAGSKISIILERSELRIENPGTVTLRTGQLFKRFASASASTAGTGLGLAIVKQICMRYKWKVVYLFSDSKHIFSIDFS